MEVIKNRVYKHFKGDYYLVLDVVIHSETKEEMVLYQGLYDDGKKRSKNKFLLWAETRNFIFILIWNESS